MLDPEELDLVESCESLVAEIEANGDMRTVSPTRYVRDVPRLIAMLKARARTVSVLRKGLDGRM